MKREEITKIEDTCAYVVKYAQSHGMGDNDDFVQELVVRVLEDISEKPLCLKCHYHAGRIMLENERLYNREILYGLFKENIDIGCDCLQQWWNVKSNSSAKDELLDKYRIYLSKFCSYRESIDIRIYIINSILDGKRQHAIASEIGSTRYAVRKKWKHFLSWLWGIGKCYRELFDLDTDATITIYFKDNNGGGG